MIQERCSCGSTFKSNEPNAVKLWREWRRKHICELQETEVSAITTSDTRTEISLGFAPPMHPGRIDTGLEE